MHPWERGVIDPPPPEDNEAERWRADWRISRRLSRMLGMRHVEKISLKRRFTCAVTLVI